MAKKTCAQCGESRQVPAYFTREQIDEFIVFLEGTLIPDLDVSHSHHTAEDFEKAIAIIRFLKRRTIV